MKRLILAGLALAALTACEEQHGKAYPGMFSYGGPLDQPVTAPILGPGQRGTLFEDAGALEPGPNNQRALGRVVSTGEDELTVQTQDGRSLQLDMRANPDVTWQGAMISQEALQPGAWVRASYDETGGQPRAAQLEVLPPFEVQRLQQQGSQPQQR